MHLRSQARAHRLRPVIGCSSEFQITNVRHSHVRLSNRHRTAQNRTRSHRVPKFKAGALHKSPCNYNLCIMLCCLDFCFSLFSISREEGCWLHFCVTISARASRRSGLPPRCSLVAKSLRVEIMSFYCNYACRSCMIM